MSWETILLENVEECPGTVCLTINRPAVMNALNAKVLYELNEAVDQITASDEIKIVIIKSAGEKAFVAGADISELQGMSAQEAYAFARRGQKLFDKIEQMDKVVIAAINGYALGGGCELSMSCDIRIATKSARFALPEATLGVIPGYGGTQRLSRIVGIGIAKQLVYTAKQITAERAYNIGLVNEVVETNEDLMAECIKMAKTISKNSMLAVQVAKKAISEGIEMEIYNGVKHEAALFATLFAAPDVKEGVAAFLEKRKPEFK